MRDAQLAFGVAAVFVAYPAAFAVAARGMPDVGGLVLVVCALRLAERLARLLALPQGHDGRIAPMTRRVAVALSLTLYAMFAFRRWYAFAAAGIAMLILSILARMAIFSVADLSFVLPVTAVGYVLAALLGHVVLSERVTGSRWLGTLLIFAGAALVSLTPRNTTLPAAGRKAAQVSR